MSQDIRYALRAITKRPLYALVTIIVLALAIGANATVFTVFNGLFLRPLPYPDDDRLVMVYSSYPKLGVDDAGTSIPDFIDRRDEAPSLESLAMIVPASRTLQGEGRPQQLSMARATPSLFSVLGIAPAVGRGFTEEEATPGADRVVVLSHRLWMTRFGAQSGTIGQDIRLDGESFRVIGVMPEGFNFFESEIDAWMPFAFTPEQAGDGQRGQSIGVSVGRMRPDATLEGLNAELAAIVQRNLERMPQRAGFLEATGFTARAEPLRETRVGDLQQMLLILQGIVAAVLLIACANVANLQLSRIVARRRELSVRTALGADRWRLTRLVLVESLALALIGGTAGLALASGGLKLVRWLGLDRSIEGFEFAVDPTVLGFTAGTSLAAALISALLPVIAMMREDPARVVNEAGRLGGGGRAAYRYRSALVVVQLAISVALLVGAGLLTKSFHRLQQEGPGFDAAGVLSVSVALPQYRYSSTESRAQFYERALEELRALPGVAEAGLTSMLPFSGENSGATIAVDGYSPPPGGAPPAAWLRSISSDYLASLDIPVIEGRDFGADETELVAVVDEVMANRFWPGGSAIGQRVRNDVEPADRWYTVVGVVPFIKHTSLTEDRQTPTIYWHYKQNAPAVGVFTLRSELPPEQLTGAARDAVTRIDPDVALYDAMPMDVRVLRSLGPQRAPMVLTLVFAAVAFTLAVVGIYGVLMWTVTQRVGEIGVRMALGAQVADVVRMILRQGVRLIAVGLAFGVAGALALGRVLSSQMHEVGGFDPGVLTVAVVSLTVAAVFASWLPAHRASRVDPMQALRED
jgi:predicted permease